MTPDDRKARLLTTLLAAAGLTHFLAPRFYDAIVPDQLPGPARAWTIGSGIAEVACAAAIANRSSRRTGSLAAIVLFVAVFPANVQMALDWQDDPAPRPLLAVLRLPLQIPLVVWAWQVARDARRRPLTVR